MSNQTREGWWPLRTVEAEANGDSKRTNEKGPSLVGSLHGLSCRTRDFCSALAALVGPVQNILFSSPYTMNRQSCGVACLLVCVSVSDSRASLLCVHKSLKSGSS